MMYATASVEPADHLMALMQVEVAAGSEEDFEKWSGWVGTRIKQLTANMHSMHGQLLARPWPKEFKVPMCALLSPCCLSDTPINRWQKRT